METCDAMMFPADDRLPQIVSLPFSPLSGPAIDKPYLCGRIPHPEVHMDYIADKQGSTAWRFHVIEALDGMLQNLKMPYIIFYPAISRDGMVFPTNNFIRNLQGNKFNEVHAWRGNLIVMKYESMEYFKMVNTTMADFPIIKNYLLTHRPSSPRSAPPIHSV